MNHRWARIKRRSQRVGGRLLSYYDGRTQIAHCVQCGAMKWARPKYLPKNIYDVYFMPYGGLAHKVRLMPPCQGLPEGYTPPMG